MEFLKKLFNFSDTISGADFFIRWIASFILQFPGGYLLGYGLASDTMGLVMLGLIIASSGLFLQFSTLMKRSRALFSNGLNHMYFYLAYIAVSIFRGFAPMFGDAINLITSLVVLLFFGYAIFKNSGISPDSHVG